MQLLSGSYDWLLGGRPVRAFAGPGPDNQPPVALDDSAVALQGETISIAALANDSDLEDGMLNVVSAVATQGTVIIEPDNVLTYSAPLNFAGDDLINYTIADSGGLTASAEIRVTVREAVLAANVEPDGTVSLDVANGMLAITVQTPTIFVGTYEVDTVTLAGGPVVLAPPAIVGVGAVGETLSAQSGLWIHDAADGTLDETFQWTRDGADISGQTSATFVVAPADTGTEIGVRQTVSNAAGARTVLAAGSVSIPA